MWCVLGGEWCKLHAVRQAIISGVRDRIASSIEVSVEWCNAGRGVVSLHAVMWV